MSSHWVPPSPLVDADDEHTTRLLDIIQRSIDSGDHAKYLLEQLREAGYVVTAGASPEEIREAAEWVVLAWDNEQTQHLAMPALREALGWPRERPSREEARRRLNAKCGIEPSQVSNA